MTAVIGLALTTALSLVAPAFADTAPTMVATRTGCRTVEAVLSIMRLADRSEREGGDLSAAHAALDAGLESGSCETIKQGTGVAIVDHEDRDSFPFVCVKPNGDNACYWISSFPTRLP